MSEKNIRVLLADDHKLFRQGLKALMDMEDGISIIGEAVDGEQAIALTDELKPDVLVLDIQMPGINGIKAAAKILATNPEVKILALSRHSERRYISEMFRVGASGYILKDTAIEELMKAIETVVDGHIYCSSDLVGVVMQEFKGRLKGEKKSLTEREIQVLKFIAEGLQTKEIANQMNLSIKTISTYRQRIMTKLDIHNVVDLTKYAIKHGLIEI